MTTRTKPKVFYVNFPKSLLDDEFVVDKVYAHLAKVSRDRYGDQFKSMTAVPVEATRRGCIRYEVTLTL